MSKSKLDLNLTTIIAGAILVGGLAYLSTKVGFFGYSGLKKEEVAAVYDKMQEKSEILSQTCGKDWFGKPFCRGIFFNGQHYPLYFRYSEDSFKMYPLFYEDWSTFPDVLGLTGRPS